jgi:hypothetical protein
VGAKKKRPQFLFVRFKVKAGDRDGYGIAEAAVPTSAIRWEGDPRSEVDLDTR